MTVIEQVAIFPPSTVEITIVVIPLLFAITLPETDIVATFSLLEDHVTVLFVAFDGEKEEIS